MPIEFKHMCMREEMVNFDNIDGLSVSIFTYDINIKQIHWRTMKL
jgi:hypothetical protein